MNTLTHQRLLEVLNYDPTTGVFTRRENANPMWVGTVAGTVDPLGYRSIQIDRKKFKASRLAWFYVHGSWPEHQIDHMNHRPNDNSIANLRQATPRENTCNRRSWRGGLKGITPRKGKFQARIRVERKLIYLGTFSKIEDAQAAYSAAAVVHHGQFAYIPKGEHP